jgi:hypothetical protein
MPMRATTVRFSEDLWEVLESEATRQGVSAAQLVRDATIMRLAFILADRDDPQAELTLERLVARTAARRRNGLPQLPTADPRRIAALHRSGLLDTPAEPRFDRLTKLASKALDAPVALVTLVDEERQFVKSSAGIDEPWASSRDVPLSHSLCQHVVVSREALVVPDAREDLLLESNLAVRDMGVIAYAGIPLITSGGEALGGLCVIDHRPRAWSDEHVAVLKDIARLVVQEIERPQ